MAKDMQMMESTKIIVYSLIWSDGKTDQSDESSNGGQEGRKWSKLIKLTELEIRVPHWTRVLCSGIREGECLDLVDVMLQIAVMETRNKANRGLPLAFELRQIKGTKVLWQILAIKGCGIIKEGKKIRISIPVTKNWRECSCWLWTMCIAQNWRGKNKTKAYADMTEWKGHENDPKWWQVQSSDYKYWPISINHRAPGRFEG